MSHMKVELQPTWTFPLRNSVSITTRRNGWWWTIFMMFLMVNTIFKNKTFILLNIRRLRKKKNQVLAPPNPGRGVSKNGRKAPYQGRTKKVFFKMVFKVLDDVLKIHVSLAICVLNSALSVLCFSESTTKLIMENSTCIKFIYNYF